VAKYTQLNARYIFSHMEEIIMIVEKKPVAIIITAKLKKHLKVGSSSSLPESGKQPSLEKVESSSSLRRKASISQAAPPSSLGGISLRGTRRI